MRHSIVPGFAAFGMLVPLVLSLASTVAAQPTDPVPPPLPPVNDPLGEPPANPTPQPIPESPPAPLYEARPAPDPRPTEEPEEMSEGRRIVVAWNTGFQWGISPGIVFTGGKASFFLGLRLGYGIDTGHVIIVPGVRLAGYFTDPGVYLGMPVLKLVYPIDRFAPFIEGGAGAGYISGDSSTNPVTKAQTGVALLAGAGFMVHFTWKFGLGVEGSYQKITGTGFEGFGIGPILALAF